MMLLNRSSKTAVSRSDDDEHPKASTTHSSPLMVGGGATPGAFQILSGMRKAPGVAPPPTMSGLEWVVEAFGCSSSSLRDTAVLEDLFNNIIREMKLRPVGETQWHQFPGTGGITGLC